MIYFKQKIPQRTTEKEEKELLDNWGEESKRRMVEGNMRIALYVARKYEGALESDDLVALAMLGLVKAGNSYDPSKGNMFSTYATKVAENEILMAIRKTKKTSKDISIFTPVGIDRNGNVLELSETLEDTRAQEFFQQIEDRDTVHSVQRVLTEKERIVVWKWIHGINQHNIAEELGVSQSQVSRIVKRAFNKMRKMV